MKTLKQKISELDSKRRERINIFFVRLFLGEEIRRNRVPADCRFTITTRGKEEILDVSFASAEILMVQHLKMPFCSLEKFNEQFSEKGIRAEKIIHPR